MTSWGCRLEGLNIERRGENGQINFALRLEEPLVLEVAPGGSCLLPVMGRSGAGKSTLLNVLSATSFPVPRSARVEWRFPDGAVFEWRGDGTSSLPLETVRARYFGYAFQQARLLPHLTVLENLTISRKNIGDSMDAASERVRALMAPAFGGNAEEVRRILELYPSQLSGGERQRVALLNAVVRDPYVLFADEPTGSLDRETRVEVMQLLREWVAAGDGQRLLIWVTHHDRDPADTGADRRLWVSDGQARFETTPDGSRWVPEPGLVA